MLLLHSLSITAFGACEEFIKDAHGLILMGRAGSGKSTVACALAKEGFTPVFCGDLIREEMKSGSELGNSLKGFADKGEPLSEESVLEALKPHIIGVLSKPFVLDSFPLSLTQFDFLHALLGEHGLQDRTKLIYVDVDYRTALSRIAYRLTCSGCAHTYNLKTCPPKNEGVCDECKATLFQRPNDQKEVAERRMTSFDRDTLPILDRAADLGYLALRITPEDKEGKK